MDETVVLGIIGAPTVDLLVLKLRLRVCKVGMGRIVSVRARVKIAEKPKGHGSYVTTLLPP